MGFLWLLFIHPHCPNCGQIDYRGKNALLVGSALSTVGFCPQLDPTLPRRLIEQIYSNIINCPQDEVLTLFTRPKRTLKMNLESPKARPVYVCN